MRILVIDLSGKRKIQVVYAFLMEIIRFIHHL